MSLTQICSMLSVQLQKLLSLVIYLGFESEILTFFCTLVKSLKKLAGCVCASLAFLSLSFLVLAYFFGFGGTVVGTVIEAASHTGPVLAAGLLSDNGVEVSIFLAFVGKHSTVRDGQQRFRSVVENNRSGRLEALDLGRYFGRHHVKRVIVVDEQQQRISQRLLDAAHLAHSFAEFGQNLHLFGETLGA